MSLSYLLIISEALDLSEKQIDNTLKLLSKGATIPFISRYRKEATQNLDETQITAIKQQYEKLVEMDQRRETIIKTIDEQGKLTEELRKQIEDATTMAELEDIYLPYKPKKKTRASVARALGLEPLAEVLMKQKEVRILEKAGEFISEKVPSVDDALQGARDIVAEWVNENKQARTGMRRLFGDQARIQSLVIPGKEEEGIKYKDYFEYEEKYNKCPSHRLMAMFRGEEEGFLRIRIGPDEGRAIQVLEEIFLMGDLEVSQQVQTAVKDAYKRLMSPSIELEFRNLGKEEADEEAIRVFADNLRQLLLAPPLGQKSVLAVDPGYRTGCKVVCLNEQGDLLHNETIYPHAPQNEKKIAAKKINALVSTYHIDAIAIGNGTASRETEDFIKKIRFSKDVQVFIVNESGASVYSASKTARDEFPEYDVTVRGAVSIGRRLMDPLAELVKIDPKSIGVGQYQHDVNQNKLKSSLDAVVESCVNQVGVNLNTASSHLLSYVSGLGPQLARTIVDYREENGPFRSRKELLKVPRLGDKAFEQSAGFLRIAEGDHPLDNSAVHPESYHIVEKMAVDMKCDLPDLISNKEMQKQIKLEQYVSENVGMPTLVDIITELEKPGRDPRNPIKVFEFSKDIFSIEDIKEGMKVPGIVTNITNFGAFVDIGVKQDGLVHISQLADRFVSHPSEVVKLHEHVMVTVISVDIDRKRIQLSMKE